MKAFRILIVLASSVVLGVESQNSDIFNYYSANKNENGITSRGQPNWDQVRCANTDICTGYPNKFPAVQQNFSWYQWDIDSMGNNCKWCPEASSDRNCGNHRQSPIDMRRYVGEDTHPLHKECKDWHWMQYKDDTCSFDDMKDHFEINRHALQIWIPVRDDGKIDCWEQGKGRRFARLDYSKGFPDWWWLQRTDISVPSQHTQEGNRYAAEVTLAHFYQIGHQKNELGYVTLLMQDYPDEPSWPFLDKLICQWREKEEKVRAACGETPAPPYGRCRIFSERGQIPTEEWLIEAGMNPTAAPTTKPSQSPTAKPTSSPSKSPTAKPTDSPSAGPTNRLTSSPTTSPTGSPILSPSVLPTKQPVLIEQDGRPPNDTPNRAPARPPNRFRPSVPAAPAFTPDSVVPPTSVPSDSPTEHPSPEPTAEPTEPPSSAPTRKPTPLPTKEPTKLPTREPTPLPTKEPTALPTGIPTVSPTEAFEPQSNAGGLPPAVNCTNYPVPGGYERMCGSSNPCCDSIRSGTNYCWNLYDNVFPGPAIESACYHCCDGKVVGPDKPTHPEGYTKTIQCSRYNSQRYCKRKSCCTDGRFSSSYCTREFAKFSPREWEEICWYCCEDSHNFVSGLESRRDLLESESEFEEDVVHLAQRKHMQGNIIEQNMIKQSSHETDDETVVMFAEGRMFRLQKEDLEPAEEDPEDYFNQIYDDFKKRHRRTKQENFIHEEDYEDVHYWPYEWMLHVGTEYYYRYEGTQTVPPCREFVHWRVMKDPMRVHPRQIAELNRLMAWRLNPKTCRKETAGVVSSDGNSINVSRDVQYRHLAHRDTFCECKDWPSKFENDKEWCRNWEEDVNFNRFYVDPYSFKSGGKWLP